MNEARYQAAWRVAASLRQWVDPCGENPSVTMPVSVWAEICGTNAPTLGGAIQRAALNQMRGDEGLAAAGLFPSIFDGLCDLAEAVRGDPILAKLPRTTVGQKEDRAVYFRVNPEDVKTRDDWYVSGTSWYGNQASEVKGALCQRPQSISLCPPSHGGHRAFVALGLQVLDGAEPPRLKLAFEPKQWPTGSLVPDGQFVELTGADLDAAAPPVSFQSFVDALLRVMQAAESLPATPAVEFNDVGQRGPDPILDGLARHLAARLCVVLQGQPGTGKTYTALRLVERLAAGGGLDKERTQWSSLVADAKGDIEGALAASEGLPLVWELVQMHPGYAYEDFVRGMATAEGSGIHFAPKDRIVLELARVAKANKDRPVLLVMDEINRCSLSSVLGELILALEPDKRNTTIRLQYGDSVQIPPNLWFLGTMNTADRSIALVDYAIRRRFRFIDIEPDVKALASFYRSDTSVEYQKAADAMNSINDAIARPHLRVGPAYFMEPPGENWPVRMADRLTYEVLPLLREYVREDGSAVKSVEGGLEQYFAALVQRLFCAAA